MLIRSTIVALAGNEMGIGDACHQYEERMINKALMFNRRTNIQLTEQVSLMLCYRIVFFFKFLSDGSL